MTAVTPSLRNSAPLLTFVIWKCVTLARSTALGVITIVAVWSSSVVALGTLGVSATALTMIEVVAVLPSRVRDCQLTPARRSRRTSLGPKDR